MYISPNVCYIKLKAEVKKPLNASLLRRAEVVREAKQIENEGARIQYQGSELIFLAFRARLISY